MVEDAVAAVSVRHGQPIEAVMDMDILSFDALVQVGVRADAHERITDAWTAMIAAQGRSKDMKKWTGKIAERARLNDPTGAVARA